MKEICVICGKRHQYTKRGKIQFEGKTIEVEEIDSPCLEGVCEEWERTKDKKVYEEVGDWYTPEPVLIIRELKVENEIRLQTLLWTQR